MKVQALAVMYGNWAKRTNDNFLVNYNCNVIAQIEIMQVTQACI